MLHAHNSSASGRRSSKLISVIVSAFTASFVQSWATFFPNQTLLALPIFDGRTICYPTDAIVRDYLSWRQADTHINNQVRSCEGSDSSCKLHRFCLRRPNAVIPIQQPPTVRLSVQYNTCFWMLVKHEGMTAAEAYKYLQVIHSDWSTTFSQCYCHCQCCHTCLTAELLHCKICLQLSR